MRFKEYYKREKLIEGGDFDIGGIRSQKIPLSKMNAKLFEDMKKDLLKFFAEVDKQFNKTYKKTLWKDFASLAKKGSIFSGSTRSMFSKDFDTFSKFKPNIGDMDIQIPEQYLDELDTFFKDNMNKSFAGFKWKAHKKGKQVNGIAEMPKKYHKYAKNIQIDFEGVDFGGTDEPTDFSVFNHYSSWTDITKGIKGVFDKFLFSSVVRGADVRDIHIVTKTGRDSKPHSVMPKKSMMSFDFHKGLRIKFKPFEDEKGKLVMTKGKPTFQLITSKDPEYIFHQDMGKIFEFLFLRSPKGSEQNDLKSFVKTMKIMKKEFDSKKVEEIFDKFTTFLWEKGGKRVEKNNPALDRELKMTAYNEFVQTFPALKKYKKKHEKLIEDYYSNFQMGNLF